MKKLFAILVVSVLTVNVTVAQNHHCGPVMNPHFEKLDSIRKSHFAKFSQEGWKKRGKHNEKKWGKHMAWGNHMGNRSFTWPGFTIQPQEETAQFVGGKEALLSWIEENITYPIAAGAVNAEGKVVVSFDVNNDGSIGNVHIEESANPLLDKEVVAIMGTMPNWIPAKQNGRNVKMKYTLPISFTAQS